MFYESRYSYVHCFLSFELSKGRRYYVYPSLLKLRFFLEVEGCRITKGFFLVNHLIFKYETLKYIYHFSSFDCVCVIKEKSITEIACTLILTPICFAKKKMHEFVRIQTLTFWNTSGCQSCNVFGNEYI